MRKLSFVTLLCFLLLASEAMAQRTALVSLNAAGSGSGNDFSSNPIISANGRFVAFTSEANNLVENDLNGQQDVFLRDLQTGKTTLVSVNHAGTGSGNNRSGEQYISPAISDDGRFVVFTSYASDLVPNYTTGFQGDVYVRDMIAGQTSLVSINRLGTGGGNGESVAHIQEFSPPGISADGRYVTFTSDANDLVASDHNGGGHGRDVFVRDLVEDKTILVSVNRAGNDTGNDESRAPSISDNGQFIAFWSSATNLVANDNNGFSDVFVRDILAGTTTLVSINFQGTQSCNYGAGYPIISANGHAVAFASTANDLVEHEFSGTIQDVFVRDLVTHTTKLASINRDGTGGGYGGSGSAEGIGMAISADGRYVAFTGANYAHLVPNDEIGQGHQVYLRDLLLDKTTLVSINRAGTGGSNASSLLNIAMSANGRFIAFTSEATDLVSNDTNGLHIRDVFVRDMVTGGMILASVNRLETGSGNDSSDRASISDNGQVVAFNSSASNLVLYDTNGRYSDNFSFRVPRPGAFQFGAALYNTSESGGTATIIVKRTGGSDGQAKVNYRTANGTATAGKDYTTATGVLTFANGEVSKSLTIPITADALDEQNETINLALSSPTGGAGLGSPTTATLSIIDDDPPPALSIDDVSVTEGRTGTVSATFTIRLSAVSGKIVNVNFATANVTATSGSDYLAASGRLTFTPGQTTKAVKVTVKGDTLQEVNETFKVNLSAASNATVADGVGICTILNSN